MASSDALPIPRKNVAYRHYFAMYKSDGTIITGWTGAAGTKSLDGAATGATTNTPTEIGSFGRGYIDLTSSEMNADALVLGITVTNVGAVALTVVLFPMEDVDIRANVIDWNGTAVASPNTAGYPLVDMGKVANTNQTARDIGASVLISSGTGTGQLDVTSGVIKANLVQILATALTETAGQLTAGFKKFFNVATPTSTMNQVTLVDTTTTLTNTPSDSTGVTTLLSRLTSGRATLLDNLSNLDALVSADATRVWANATRTLSSISDSAGVTTLLSRLTATRAGLLDNLDAAISGVSASVWASVSRTLTSVSDSSGVTTLLTRIASALTITSGKVDVNNVAAIQSGLATGTDISNLQTHGDSAWTTAILTGLLTSSAFTSALSALQSHGDSTWATAVITSLLTSSDFDSAITALQAHGDSVWADSVEFNEILDQLAIIEAKTSLITSDNFTVSGPNVPGTTNLQFTEDNDYTLTSGRALPDFSNSDWAVYSLTTAESVLFKTKTRGDAYSFSKPLIVNSDIDLTLELTAEELSHFGPTISMAELETYESKHTFTVQAVLASGDKVTLAQGRIFILEDI